VVLDAQDFSVYHQGQNHFRPSDDKTLGSLHHIDVASEHSLLGSCNVIMDLKYEYQKRAEEIAEETFGCGFYSLNERTKTMVWKQAEQDVTDRLYDQAEQMREEQEIRKLEK